MDVVVTKPKSLWAGRLGPGDPIAGVTVEAVEITSWKGWRFVK